MKITRKDKYVLLEDEKNELSGFANYLTRNERIYEKDNIIVDLSEFEELELKELLMFLEISNVHRAKKRSFVIVNKALAIDKVPDEIIVVPTLQEGEDIIDMEELERELGF